jgi:hypothetical protein
MRYAASVTGSSQRSRNAFPEQRGRVRTPPAAEALPGRHGSRRDGRGFVQVGTFTLAGPVRAVEGVEHEPCHVERCEKRGGQAERPERIPQRVCCAAGEGGAQDGVFREEARERRHAGDRERRDPQQAAGPGEKVPQPAHVAHVLGVLMRVRGVVGAVHGVDHAARTEEQQRLEERMRREVKDAGRVRSAPHAQEHISELEMVNTRAPA